MKMRIGMAGETEQQSSLSVIAGEHAKVWPLKKAW